MTSTLGQSVGLDVWHVGFSPRILYNLVSVSIVWFALYVFTGLSNSFMRSFLPRPFQINAVPTSVADPDLETRGGGGDGLPPKFFHPFGPWFSLKLRGGPRPPGPSLDPPLNIIK